ncbi:unnamed protein product [Lactuca virosa]|uniref:Uncharacterized protein n=1 Tax=Lactuca virosa TaxID=75947 RepID=A0AAU9M7D6_9ASTR|nr:unnamed protein product [Lactuca virosa]
MEKIFILGGREQSIYEILIPSSSSDFIKKLTQIKFLLGLKSSHRIPASGSVGGNRWSETKTLMGVERNITGGGGDCPPQQQGRVVVAHQLCCFRLPNTTVIEEERRSKDWGLFGVAQINRKEKEIG